MARVLALVAAFTWSAAICSPARADFAAGLAAFDAGDYRTALVEWRETAERGDVEAQVALAGLYLNGQGLAADPGAATYWYRRAAERGDAVAQLNLGDLYARGVGVPRDLVEAYVWLSLAAAQGRRWPALRRDEVGRALSDPELAEAKTRLAGRRDARAR